MPIVHRAGTWRRARPWLSALSAMALLLAALAGPVLARVDGNVEQVAAMDQARGSRLRDPAVWPRAAPAGTTIHFAVTWRGTTDAPPKTVRVAIDGRRRTMPASPDRASGGRGIRFGLTEILAAGRHPVRFEAIGPTGKVVTLRAGWVVVSRRAEPSSGPSAGGGSTGGGDPADDPIGSGIAEVPRGTGDTPSAPGARAEGVDVAGGVGSTSDPRPPEGAGVPRVASPGGAVEEIVSVERSTRDDRATRPSGAGGGSGGGGGAGGAGGGPSASLGLGPLGPADGPFDRAFRAYPVLISTGGSAAVWAAFVIFGKKRRDGEPPAPDAVLAFQAATGPDAVATASLVPPPAEGRTVPPGVDPNEAALPRWRRPSLLLARKTDPLRTASTAVSLTFAEATVSTPDGVERRRIRYRLVRLLDVPDEVRAREIGILDAGDEVQILDTYGTYRLVGCPDGQQGWLHKMVLGDLVEASDDGSPDGIDEDVLAAFLATRQKTA